MSYTDLEKIRKKLADPYKNGNDSMTVDEETTLYQLSHHPIREGSVVVTVENVEKALETDYSINYDTGLLTFVEAPTDEQLIEVVYEYSVFSDDELQEFLDEYGTVDKVILECLEILLVDAARRFDYAAGLTDVKASQVFDHIEKLIAYYKGKATSGTSAPTGIRRANRHYGYNQSDPDAFIGQESVKVEGDLSRSDNL